MERSGIAIGESGPLAEVLKGHSRNRYVAAKKTGSVKKSRDQIVPPRGILDRDRCRVGSIESHRRSIPYHPDKTLPDRFKLRRGDILLATRVHKGRVRLYFVGLKPLEDLYVIEDYIIVRRRPGASLDGFSVTPESLYGLMKSELGLAHLLGNNVDLDDDNGVVTLRVQDLREMEFAPPERDSVESFLSILELETRLGLINPVSDVTSRVVDDEIDSGGGHGNSDIGSYNDTEDYNQQVEEIVASQFEQFPFDPIRQTHIRRHLMPWLWPTKSEQGWNRKIIGWLLKGVLRARMDDEGAFENISVTATSVLRDAKKVSDMYQAGSLPDMSEDTKVAKKVQDLVDAIVPWTNSSLPIYVGNRKEEGLINAIQDSTTACEYLCLPTGVLDEEIDLRVRLDGGLEWNKNNPHGARSWLPIAGRPASLEQKGELSFYATRDKNIAEQQEMLVKLIDAVCSELSAPHNLENGPFGIVAHLYLVIEGILNDSNSDVATAELMLDGLQIGLVDLASAGVSDVRVAVRQVGSPSLAANPRILANPGRTIHLFTGSHSWADSDDRPDSFLRQLIEGTGNEVGRVIKTKLNVTVATKKKRQTVEIETPRLEWDEEQTKKQSDGKVDWLKMGQNRTIIATSVRQVLSHEDWSEDIEVTEKRLSNVKVIEQPQYERILAKIPDDTDADLMINEIRQVMTSLGPEGIAVIQLPAKVLWQSEFAGTRHDLVNGHDECGVRWTLSDGDEFDKTGIVRCVFGVQTRVDGPEVSLLDRAFIILNRKAETKKKSILMIDAEDANISSIMPVARARHTIQQIAVISHILASGTTEGVVDRGAVYVDVADVIEGGSKLLPKFFLSDSQGWRDLADIHERKLVLEALSTNLESRLNRPSLRSSYSDIHVSAKDIMAHR